MKMNLYLLYGGKSVEHEVSLQTAKAVFNALDKEKYHVHPIYITKEGVWCSLDITNHIVNDVKELQVKSTKSVPSSVGEFLLQYFPNQRDEVNEEEFTERHIFFPVLHGTFGEDGTIQGLIELLDLPYVGNGVMASAVGIDKVMMKTIFDKAGIPQTKYYSLLFHEWMEDGSTVYLKIEETLGYPVFVKPARLGSSVGIHRCRNRQELEDAIQEAFMYDQKLIIEKEVIGREMQVGVIGNDRPHSSVVGEYIQERPFMDYKAKYVDGKLIPVIPARISPELHYEMQEIAIRAFNALNCAGLVRVDFFVTEENEALVNEVNTLPGFTEFSMFPALWEKTDGTTYPQLIDELIQLAIERYDEQRLIKFMR